AVLAGLRDVGALDDHVGFGKRLVDIPSDNVLAYDRVRHGRMEQRGVIAHGLDRVEDGGKYLVVNLDMPRRFGGDLLALGGDSGHRLAEEAHGVLRKHVHLRAAVGQRLASRYVVVRDDGADAGNRSGLCSVDAQDASVVMWAAQDLCVEHALALLVGCVSGRASNVLLPIRLSDPRADSYGIAVLGARPAGLISHN